jgi:hypothetical protein
VLENELIMEYHITLLYTCYCSKVVISLVRPKHIRNKLPMRYICIYSNISFFYYIHNFPLRCLRMYLTGLPDGCSFAHDLGHTLPRGIESLLDLLSHEVLKIRDDAVLLGFDDSIELLFLGHRIRDREMRPNLSYPIPRVGDAFQDFRVRLEVRSDADHRECSGEIRLSERPYQQPCSGGPPCNPSSRSAAFSSA